MKPFEAILLNKAVKGGGGVVPSGSLSISANGTYDVTAFAEAIVAVGGEDRLELATSGALSNINVNVATVRSYAFANYPIDISVSLPAATRIEASAFYSASIVSFFAPSVTYLGSYALQKALRSQITEISFPQLLNVGAGAFANNYNGLEKIYAPLCSGLAASAFSGCFQLSDLTLAWDEIQTVPVYCFGNCYVLPEVHFSVVSAIYASAFVNCSKLESVYLYSNTVVSLNAANAFVNTPISKSSYLGYFGSVYVPSSLVASYKAAAIWSVYADRITAIV